MTTGDPVKAAAMRRELTEQARARLPGKLSGSTVPLQAPVSIDERVEQNAHGHPHEEPSTSAA